MTEGADERDIDCEAYMDMCYIKTSRAVEKFATACGWPKEDSRRWRLETQLSALMDEEAALLIFEDFACMPPE